MWDVVLRVGELENRKPALIWDEPTIGLEPVTCR